MIEAPVVAQFDSDGRLFVIEMRGFMRSPEGTGEDQPTGRISLLEDLDSDGRMDKRTTFLDGLVMPRAMAVTRDGLLVAEPPRLWFCRDTDGDGRADEKTEVASDYGDRKNPEHTANGLVLAMDNWFYSLYHTWRYRWIGNQWVREPVPNRVQWGMSQDDQGRLFFTQNSDLLRADLYSSAYAGRAPTARIPFLNHVVARDQAVWPVRVTAGVNRGYQPATLRPDGTLAQFTAACGTVVYRGDNFPESSRNQAFVCEPSANLIRQQNLWQEGASILSSNALGKAEFLTSTDERFRPVNLLNGPDGALYVVDFARGIIQHRIYMTTYLRRQVEQRKLDQPTEVGRIYRVVHKQGRLRKASKLSKASSTELVGHLRHSNGWWRDTAQRLLVERNDPTVTGALTALAEQPGELPPRLHALWTLEGMGRVSGSMVERMLMDPEAPIRSVGLRLSERFLQAGMGTGTALRKAVGRSIWNDTTAVRIQAALSLGTLRNDTNALQVLRELFDTTGSEWIRQAAALGLGLLDPQTNTVTASQLAGLSDSERKQFQAGKEVYAMACAACHQPHGLGQEGLAPPLLGSEWVAGSASRLARMVLHGVRGPIQVKGQTYQLEMPPLSVLSDEQIANSLTYVRREWGHAFAPVTTEAVRRIRETTRDREQAWTQEELLGLP